LISPAAILQVQSGHQGECADLDREVARLLQPLDALGAQLVHCSEFVQRA
jgi:hypothetical protein